LNTWVIVPLGATTIQADPFQAAPWRFTELGIGVVRTDQELPLELDARVPDDAPRSQFEPLFSMKVYPERVALTPPCVTVAAL
jgi:hypothetical protein